MTGKRRTLAIVLVIELAVGAVLWFANAPSDARAEAPQLGTVASDATPAKSKCPPPQITWAKDMRVTHDRYGEGVVVDAKGKGDLATVDVTFDSGRETVTGVTLVPWKKPLRDDLIPIGILILVITVVTIRLP